MDAESNAQPDVLVEDGQPVATRPINSHSPRALLQSVFREDRFFLVLWVFIGVFSGLAVVCFRFAIGWCRLYLLGSGAVLSPSRLLLAPTLAGLVIAVLVIHFFPQARGSGVNHQGRAVYLQRIYPDSHGDREVHHGGAGNWIGAFPGAGGSVAANWRMSGIGAGAADAVVARSHAADCAGGRCGWTGSRVQCADLGGSVCD